MTQSKKRTVPHIVKIASEYFDSAISNISSRDKIAVFTAQYHIHCLSGLQRPQQQKFLNSLRRQTLEIQTGSGVWLSRTELEMSKLRCDNPPGGFKTLWFNESFTFVKNPAGKNHFMCTLSTELLSTCQIDPILWYCNENMAKERGLKEHFKQFQL